MTKENKIYTGIFVFGVLLLLTGNPLMMGCGAISIMLYPLAKFTEYSSNMKRYNDEDVKDDEWK